MIRLSSYESPLFAPMRRGQRGVKGALLTGGRGIPLAAVIDGPTAATTG